jgi:hypothetical protein
MRIPRALALALASVLISSAAGAQSFNVDFGDVASVPASSYAGVGSAGTWNAVGVLPPAQRQALRGLDGVLTSVNIFNIGGTSMLTANDPATAGDDEALVDDMLLGFNNPLDVCIWFEHLANGTYEVITYAITPSNPPLQSRVRVDDGNPGPIMVGGAWPGGHVEGITYGRHIVTITDGIIGLHSGLYGGVLQSGMNGIQIRPAGATSVGSSGAGAGAILWIDRVAPNPALGRQVFELSARAASSAAIEVFDLAGQLVWRSPLARVETGTMSVAWDGTDLRGARVPAGAYVARVLAGEGGGGVAPAAGASGVKLIRLR